MRIVRAYHDLPAELRGAAVAVGNFDGVHLGHRAVITEAGRVAKAHGLPWAVLTLEPHPRSVFMPETPPFRLTPFPIKARLIEALEPELLVVIRFDAAFARLPARAFVEQVLVQGLRARHVVCGHDFAFGQGRKGTPELLLWLGDEFGFDFTCVQEVRDADGEPYSSTRVRERLKTGDPAGAARLLGRPFEIEGVVVEGDRRGRTIGYPTANLRLGEYLCPARGVYAVKVGIDHGSATMWHDGVANLGVRPTFGGGDVVLEVHLLDFAGDLYGRRARVGLIEFLRAEKKFDGLEALKAQIADDSARARRVLRGRASENRAERASRRETGT